MRLPIVSIVGRPNVGKSSLLNGLARRRISIVDPTPGVTRDRVATPLALGEGEDVHSVELVDTGGMGIEDTDDLTEDVESQIAFGIASSDVILFVVDARDGLLPLDRHVAEQLRKVDTPVIVLANKIDEVQLVSEVAELARLGFGEPLPISAMHGRNLDTVLERIEYAVRHLPPGRLTETKMKLAIVGKRNAGKSTLINALAGEERVIVSTVAGTTRDSVDVHVEIGEDAFTLIDTAGVRKKRKIATDVEFYSQHRALRSVRRADVTALMVDASLPVSQVDKALVTIILEEHKPCLIVVNKWDLAEGYATTEEYAEYFNKLFPMLAYAPIIFTSATEGVNIREVVKLAQQLFVQASRRVPTAKINEVMRIILEKRGPSHKAGTKPPKIFFASQVTTEPPTIVCIVNDTRSFSENFIRFLTNQFRDYLPFPEVPIRILLRSRRGKERENEK
jgi:GTP-binding protein